MSGVLGAAPLVVESQRYEEWMKIATDNVSSPSLCLSHKLKESTEGMRIIDFAENHFDQYLEFGTH